MAVRRIVIDEPTILDFGQGIQIRVSPIGAGRRSSGRQPSAPTQELIHVMEQDAQLGTPRTRATYISALRKAGYEGSDAAAGQIVSREAKRVFDAPLPRSPTRKARTRPKAGRGPGRKPSRATTVLRQKLAQDAAQNQLRDAMHYTRWLVDQPRSGVGLKAARPIVYRELRRLSE